MLKTNYDMGLVRSVKAAVVRKGIQHVFANRLRRAQRQARKLIIASPWVTCIDMVESPLVSIISIIKRHQLPTYVFTRPPENTAEIKALNMLAQCPSVEIVHNPNLHAKLYICLAPYPYGFAMLGSANLTHKSEELHEIGLIVLAAGGGEEIIRQLASFGMDYLRTRSDSSVQKRLRLRRKNYGL